MANTYTRWPATPNGITVYATAGDLPATAASGACAVVLDTNSLYEYNGAWFLIGSASAVLGIGTLDGQSRSADGATIAANLLYLQTADATHAGLIGTGTQTFAGTKTFGALTATTWNGNTILVGAGTLDLATFTLHVTGTASISGSSSGTNTGDVTIGTANGLSITSQALSLALSSTSTTGALSSTDWNTFNGKQASGNYITALTGDATAAGPGSAALTLATVNATTGSFGSSTAIPVFTVNAKGLITAASTAVVIAPADTLTGTTLNSTVVTSSLTAVGTLATGVWNATAISTAKGGTGGDSSAQTGLAKVAAGTWSYATLVNTDVSASAAIAFSKLASLTSAHILVGSAGNVATDVAVSGDITMSNAGATALVATTNATLTTISTLVSVGTITTGTWSATAIGATKGGTAQTTWTLGDTLYSDASNSLAKLAGNTTTTKKYLSQTGNGSVSAAPAWAQVAFSDLSGSVAAAQMPALTGDVTTSAGAVATTVAKIQSTTVSGTTGTANVVFSASPAFTGNPTYSVAAGSVFTMTTSAATSGDNALAVVNTAGTTTGDPNRPLYIQKQSTTNTTSQKFLLFAINAGATLSGEIAANGASQAAFQSASDRRLKENITPLSGELARILALNPVEFDYIEGGHQTGFIAQELQEQYPDAVSIDPDGLPGGTYKVTGWDKTTARLVKAIQELEARLALIEQALGVK